MHANQLTMALLLASSAALTACGGSGSSNDMPEPEPSSISAENAEVVSSDVATAIAFDQSSDLLDMGSFGALQSRTLIDDNEPCTVSGSAHTVADMPSLTSFVLTLQYDQCDEGDEQIDGRIDVALSNIDEQGSLDYQLTFTELSGASDSDGSFTIDGGESGQLDFMESNRTQMNSQGSYRSTINARRMDMLDFSRELIVISSPEAETLHRFDGTLVNPLGQYSIRTLVPLRFTYPNGNPQPESGSYRVEGTDNSSMVVEITADHGFYFEVDTDGDGEIDVTGTHYPEL